jgi:hypothetical protein
MSNWIDFDMLMSELDLYRNNAARIVKAYKEINNPTDWDKLECKEAVGRVVVSECIMTWCKDFKFSSNEVIDIINKEKEEQQ